MKNIFPQAFAIAALDLLICKAAIAQTPPNPEAPPPAAAQEMHFRSFDVYQHHFEVKSGWGEDKICSFRISLGQQPYDVVTGKVDVDMTVTLNLNSGDTVEIAADGFYRYFGERTYSDFDDFLQGANPERSHWRQHDRLGDDIAKRVREFCKGPIT